MGKRVLIILRMSGVAGQEKLSGILRYLGDQHEWEPRLIRTREELTRQLLEQELASGIDGIIVGMRGASDITPTLLKTDIPTVSIDLFQRELAARRENISFVQHSDVELGREAARQLISQGLWRGYAFVHFPGIPLYSAERCAGFRAAIREAGLWCDVFGEEGNNTPDALRSFLRHLPKPVAILAANDDCGFDVLSNCQQLRLRVPRQVAVLGVDNDVMICEHANPALSSVHPDNERAGFLAAAELDRLMAEGDHVPRHIHFGIRQIVQRASTADASRAGRLVQRALAFINENAARGISVADVVSHLKVSRRLAELRFRQLQRGSIGEAITERRIEELKRRLLHSRQTIESVTLSSGFESINYAKNLFKRRFGVTMREWRQQHCATNPCRQEQSDQPSL